MKDWILEIIERWSAQINSWAWDQRWKKRDPHEWIKGYRKWKNEKKNSR